MKQQSSAKVLDVEERFGRAIEQARDIIGEHARLCAERVAAAEEAAQSDIARFEEASEQLAQERRELARLEEEKKQAPFQAYKANMDGDTAREREIRKAYQEIKPADLELLRARCGELEAEIWRLGGTAHGAEKQAHKNILDTYDSVIPSLEAFEGRIVRLKEATTGDRAKLQGGRRRAEEHLQFLRQFDRDERREAQREAASREAAAREALGRRRRS